MLGGEEGISIEKVVVLLSGGLDSATTLAIAKARGDTCYALTFDYGQRHRSELAAARRICDHLGVEKHLTFFLEIGQFGGSALTDPNISPSLCRGRGIPLTYVPARNTVFLSIALAWAENLSADKILIGANAVDYSGYPDCRPEFISAFEEIARLGTKQGVEGHPIRIEAPLVSLTKSEIIKKGIEAGVDYSLTVSCYQADEKGRACGECDSCYFRAKGFAEAGIPDPTVYTNGR